MPAIRAIEIYPCRCLCFWFVQITRTTPSRRTILHLSHIRLTDALTFIRSPFHQLSHPLDDSSPADVPRRERDEHAVSREDPDEVAPHVARQVRRHLVPAVERHPVERPGQLLGNRAGQFPVTGAPCHAPSGAKAARE